MSALLKSSKNIHIAKLSDAPNLVVIESLTSKLLTKFQTIQSFAKEDKIAINKLSFVAAQLFLEHHNLLPALFLLDNGNLRALWRDGKNQIGLQFLDAVSIQYVLMSDEDGSLQTCYGRVMHPNILPLIGSMNLEKLLHAE